MLTAAIPLVVFLLAAFVIFQRSKLSVRESLLVSVTISTAWLVAGTELLSLLHQLAFWPVLLWWLMPLPALAFFAFRWRTRRNIFSRWPGLRIFDCVLLSAIAFIMGWAFLQALFSPPNNVDAQEYHLQRQVFWMQQHSVEHFPTSNLRQVAMPPLAEFAGLHLMILTGNDRYLNLLQWLAMLFSLFAVSLTTRRFNGSATAQLLASLWTVTIPLAFMQASNTKNDLVVMMWLCLLAYWVLLLDTRSRLRIAHVALIGLAFGALVLSKGTGMIFGLPIAAFAGLYLLRCHLRNAFPAMAVMSAMALLLNAGHCIRNYRTFGSIAPDKPGIHAAATLGSEDHSVGATVSSMLRSIGSHLVTPSKAWNEKLTQAMRDVHQKMGRDIDDPKTTWIPYGHFRPYQFLQDNEDRAGAPAHMLLVLLLPVAMLFTRKQLPWRASLPLLAMFFGGFVLFSLLLKWQAWHVRLVIPLPAIIAPVFGWCYGAARLRYLAPIAALFLLVTLTPSLNCVQRPLLGEKNIFRTDPLALRCYNRPEWAEQYRALVERIREVSSPKIVGFYTETLPEMAPDYPMQRLMLDRFWAPFFIAFNAKLQIPGKPEPDPDVLLVVRSKAKRLQHNSTGTWYVADRQFGRYTLFLKENAEEGSWRREGDSNPR